MSTNQLMPHSLTLLDTADLCRYLKVRPNTIYRWLSMGMPYYRAMDKGHYRFNPTDICVWLSGQRNQVRRKIQKIKALHRRKYYV